jgi:hypothetical protein
MWPNPFFVKINASLLARKNCLTYFQKMLQNSPDMMKFTVSGHPGGKVGLVFCIG